MVKFAMNGSDVTTAAVKLARAKTGRDLVVICGLVDREHSDEGWDPVRVAMTVKFDYNDPPSVHALFDAYPDRIAAVILEAATSTETAPGFLEGLRSVTEEHGAVLIFDEMITALRWSRHGARSVYGITPDLSIWGKAIGNGFSVSALAGKRALLSTSHGAETTGLAAYLPFPRRTQNETWLPKSRFRAPSCAPGLSRSPRRRGYRSTWSSWDAPHVRCLRPQTTTANRPFRTLFVQELLRRGVLGQSLLISAAHTDTDINQTIDAAAGAPEMYTRAIEVGSTDGLLVGRHLARALREFTEPRRLRPDYITGTGGAA